MNICTVDDEFVRNESRWVAVLTDGTKVYQDDNRAGVYPYSAWTRLRNHCLNNGLAITQFHIQFRNNIIPINLDGCKALHFTNMGFALLSQSGITHHCFVIGQWNNGVARMSKYKTPELVQIFPDEQTREIPEDSPTLIPVAF